jgi:hypothetical protein
MPFAISFQDGGGGMCAGIAHIPTSPSRDETVGAMVGIYWNRQVFWGTAPVGRLSIRWEPAAKRLRCWIQYTAWRGFCQVSVLPLLLARDLKGHRLPGISSFRIRRRRRPGSVFFSLGMTVTGAPRRRLWPQPASRGRRPGPCTGRGKSGRPGGPVPRHRCPGSRGPGHSARCRPWD